MGFMLNLNRYLSSFFDNLLLLMIKETQQILIEVWLVYQCHRGYEHY